MTSERHDSGVERALAALEGRMDDLLRLCDTLRQENTELRAELGRLQEERRELLATREQARTQVEAMIERLRSLEKPA